MDIEIATNQELIDELNQRQTFAGIIISSENEHCFDGQIHNQFRLQSRIDQEDVAKILEICLCQVGQQR